MTAIPSPVADATRPHRALHWMILAGVILALLTLPLVGSTPGPRANRSSAVAAESTDLLLRVVRTGPAEASVLGVALTLNDTIELLVDGVPVANTTPVWNLDYWFLHVPVLDNATVQIRIGLVTSPVVSVPAYVAQPVGPPRFVYAEGTRLPVNGSPIQFFGVKSRRRSRSR